MPETLTQEVLDKVWRTLHSYRWFGKHVEDDALDHCYESLRDGIAAAIGEHTG